MANKSAHQYNNTTSLNRYPIIFEKVSRQFETSTPKNILSFGCSTGEECYSLSQYFPDSSITGADINFLNLRKARQNYLNEKNISFIHSDELFKNNQTYDIFFCMSVLCRWEETMKVENCKKIYPFSHFENILNKIDKKIKHGGILVIYNSNYKFIDTKVSQFYQPLSFAEISESGFVHKFDQNCNKLHDLCYPFVIFKKK